MFEVMGRGELHLTILLENMRREGYELAVSKPRVVFHEVERRAPRADRAASRSTSRTQHQGGVMQALGERKGDLVNMEPDGRGRVRLEYRIPARGLIGFPNEFLNLTRGSGLISQHLRRLRAVQGRDRQPQERRADLHGRRRDLHLCAGQAGRPRPHVRARPNDPVYEGMIVGIHSRDNDLVVNADAHQAADQLPRLRQGRRDQDHAADRSSRWNTASSSSRTTSWSRSRPSRSACASAT